MGNSKPLTKKAKNGTSQPVSHTVICEITDKQIAALLDLPAETKIVLRPAKPGIIKGLPL